ncbi:DNA-binding NarL/FixJ family response regulator [Labrenzia sp. EL_195]|nr:DNA-binding NarL/FixJ family response regulator [Labrenzia sp. EL_195]
MQRIIYLATSPSGKSYVGQTTKRLETRRKGHEYAARTGSKLKFHRALRQHGLSTFTWQVIATAESAADLNALEMVKIEEHDTFRNGYNLTLGGEGGKTVSQDIVDEIFRLYAEGVGKQEISNRVLVTRRVVYDTLRNEPKRRPAVILRLTTEKKAEAAKLWGEGHTGTDIARAVGVSIGTVNRFLREAGLRKQRA